MKTKSEFLFGLFIVLILILPVKSSAEQIELFPAQDLFSTFQPDNFDNLCRFDECPNGESKLGLKTLTLTCESGDTAKITTDNVSSTPPFNGTGVIVDNEMFVNHINVCDLGDVGGQEDPGGNFNCFISSSATTVGHPIQDTFTGIGEITLSVGNGAGDIIPLGTSTLTVELKDWGDRAGNTNLILDTTCSEVPPVPGCGEEAGQPACDNILISPPLAIPDSGALFYQIECLAVNAGTAPLGIRVRVIDQDGTAQVETHEDLCAGCIIGIAENMPVGQSGTCEIGWANTGSPKGTICMSAFIEEKTRVRGEILVDVVQQQPVCVGFSPGRSADAIQ